MEELCPDCKKLKFVVKVEVYRTQPLERCTVHHWLMNAEPRGWELERYVSSSERYNFRCSLPTEEQISEIRASRRS